MKDDRPLWDDLRRMLKGAVAAVERHMHHGTGTEDVWRDLRRSFKRMAGVIEEHFGIAPDEP